MCVYSIESGSCQAHTTTTTDEQTRRHMGRPDRYNGRGRGDTTSVPYSGGDKSGRASAEHKGVGGWERKSARVPTRATKRKTRVYKRTSSQEERARMSVRNQGSGGWAERARAYKRGPSTCVDSRRTQAPPVALSVAVRRGECKWKVRVPTWIFPHGLRISYKEMTPLGMLHACRGHGITGQF